GRPPAAHLGSTAGRHDRARLVQPPPRTLHQPTIIPGGAVAMLAWHPGQPHIHEEMTMRSRRKLSLLSAGAATVMVLVGCSSQSPETTSTGEGGPVEITDELIAAAQ